MFIPIIVSTTDASLPFLLTPPFYFPNVCLLFGNPTGLLSTVYRNTGERLVKGAKKLPSEDKISLPLNIYCL